MARAEDVAMKEYRRIRRKMNQRLLRAKKEGRLGQELRVIEREGMEYYQAILKGTRGLRKRAK